MAGARIARRAVGRDADRNSYSSLRFLRVLVEWCFFSAHSKFALYRPLESGITQRGGPLREAVGTVGSRLAGS